MIRLGLRLIIPGKVSGEVFGRSGTRGQAFTMRIVLADDHGLIRDGIKPFLYELSDDVTILEAGDFDTALTLAEEREIPDLVLLDLKMPGMNGFSGLQTMASRFPSVPVVIMSGYFDRKDVLDALDCGAAGYIPKTMSGPAMLNALRLILSGEKYLPSSAFNDDGKEDARPGPEAPAAKAKNDSLSALTAREVEILKLLIEGRTNKEIARDLDLQEITIKIHVRNVYRKINASNRAQAVSIALRSGWGF